ncbi:flagellar hook-associated protein FlgK [Endozoicomonadaceae bacterium StTr2]
MSIIHNAMAGLTSAQMALDITSQNIANSTVAGYSRQQVLNATSPTGTVYVSDVQRVSDNFLTSQVWESASDYGKSLSFSSQATMLEKTVTAESTSLSPALNEFFGSLNDAAGDPADIPHRQQVLSNANSLASRFNTLQSRLQTQYKQVNDQLGSVVGEANGLLQQLAGVNEAIGKTSTQDGGVPNHLLDTRDKLVQQVSELMDVKAEITDNGSANLTLSNGDMLVMGSEANSLALVAGTTDPAAKQLVLKTGTAEKPVTQVGGSVQGLIDFRDGELNDAMRKLGRLALVTVDAINSELKKGFDLEGNKGTPLFTDINNVGNRASAMSGNKGDAVLDVEITDTSKLTASDYRVDFIENPSTGKLEYRVTRGSDDEVVAKGTDMPIEFEGVSISVPEGKAQAGDSFSVEPTRNFASSVSVSENITPKKLAFSSEKGATGNNDIVNKLIGLKDKNLVGGEYSISEGWSQLSADVVSTSASAKSKMQAGQQLYQHAQNKELSVSGVNKDEEAMNMVRFQQSYQANAKVIAASQKMLETILAI